MFRISQFMHELAHAEAAGVYPAPVRRVATAVNTPALGPVVIWNLIRRCNLTCKHCYAFSADHDYPGELSTEQVFSVLDDLKAFNVRALILSGGEPLLRPDIFEIAAHAKAMGFYIGLSTNGTLIDEAMAQRVHALGFDYVGISLDGIGATHDRFRRMQGAFDLSLAAIRHLHALGTKVGLRFTMTELNAFDLPHLLQLMRDEQVDKFYFSHLNYAGRGNIHRGQDAHHLATRQALDLLFDTAWADAQAGGAHEFVTGNNDADGVYLLQWVAQRFPQWHDALRNRLIAWGGNSSGMNVANIDNLGDVHPDTMWWHHTLGNVKARPFSEIWQDTGDPLMAGLKTQPRPVHGRCGACRHLPICGGNTRVRAQQVTGDAWAEDPGCYLSDEEIGVHPDAGSARVTTTAYGTQRAPRRVINLAQEVS